MNTNEQECLARMGYAQTTICIVIPVFPGITEPQYGTCGYN